jgi:oligoendopeptidase F
MNGDPMNPLRDVTLCILGLSLAASSSALSQQRDRSKIPESYRWNLADLYPTDDAWKTAKEAFSGKIGASGKEEGVMQPFRGKLSESPQTLLACFELTTDLEKEFMRLSAYASMASDQDTRDPKYLAMVQAMGQIGSTLARRWRTSSPRF